MDQEFSVGGAARDLTDAEDSFLELVLGDEPPFLDAWCHVDEDGTPWLIVSMDLFEGNSVRDTLRLDFDADGVRGGWSKFFLNGDDGVRSGDAEVDCAGEDGLIVQSQDIAKLAMRARTWFKDHYESWPASQRRQRWHT